MTKSIDYFTLKSDTYFLENTLTVRQALEKFDFHKFSVVPIIDKDGFYIGTISEGDILRFLKNKCEFNTKVIEKIKITDIERYRSYKALSIDSDFNSIIDLSIEQNFIPVVDGRGIYIGIVKRKDIIERLKYLTSIDN